MSAAHGPDGGGMFHGLDVTELLREFGVPGCSVAVMDDGEVTERRAFGVRSVRDKEPVTPQTVFQACSVSKPVAVLGALRLAESGDLDLDADVNEHLTGWTVPPNGSWQPRVTLRQAASHTAGLGTVGFAGYPADSRLPSLIQVLSGVAPANSPGVRAETVPGLGFRYSGGGTTVVQLLLEETTGTATAPLLKELVLDPLGMAESTFAQPLPERDAGHAAHGHRPGGVPVPGRWHVYPEQCAAGLWSTPTDLLRFARAVQDSWHAVPGSLLAPHTAAQLLAPHAVLPRSAVRPGGLDHIGLGPFLRMRGGTTDWFGHAGANEGFRCHVMAGARTGQGAAVMTNGDAGFAVVGRVFQTIANAYGWEGVDFHPVDPVAPDVAAAHAGAFVTDTGIAVELSTENGIPRITIGNQPAARLEVTAEGRLVAEEAALVVRPGADDSITLEQNGQSFVCRRDEGRNGGARN